MSEISHKKIKILFPAIHYAPVIGGIETWTREIAERLTEKADVFVITGKVRGETAKETKNQVKIFRVSLFALKNLSHSPIFYTLSALLFIYYRSRKIIKQEQIDCLHCSGFLSALIGYFLKKSFQIPYIITIQSLQEKKPFQKLKIKVYQNADYCIASSKAIADYFIKIKVASEKIKIIPNGIDFSRFGYENKEQARKRFNFGPEDFVVGVVARLEKVKGIEYLIKAMKRFKLLIIGDGAERTSLERLAKELSFKERIIFAGPIPNAQLPQYLSACDCFCLPSIQEGFGIAVLEAMAAGLPVAVSKVGGILDLIQDKKTGLLVPAGDSEAIEKALLWIYQNKAQAQELAKNAKASLAKYSWPNIADQVYALHLSFNITH